MTNEESLRGDRDEAILRLCYHKNMNQALTLIFQLAVLLFSVIIHEVSHGLAALKLGDTTARDAGRLTLNPLKHLDLFGSLILPLSLFFATGGAFVLGWAKPVPYNPFNLKNPRRGAGIIAALGPISNFSVAIIFALILRAIFPFAEQGTPAEGLVAFLGYIVFINVLLAIFNLVPLPPLDGSGILFSLLPTRLHFISDFLSRYGLWILLLFIFFGFQLIIPIVSAIYGLLVGGAAIF
jgi:Zn-dependent protease